MNSSSFMKYYEKYMNILGPIGNMMFFLQAYKIFSTKDAVSISVSGFALSFVSVCSWLAYGFLIKNKPLIIANIVGVTGATLVLAGTFLYS